MAGKRAVVLGAIASVLMLTWPALVNGGAFFFPDTGTYLRSADAIVGELTGLHSEWSDRRALYVDSPQERAAPASQNQPPSAAAEPAEAGPLHPVLLGRSIYYGLAVFPLIVLFGSAAAALFQGGLAVLTIWLCLAAFGCERSRMPAMLLLTSAALASLTSLPFFVSMLMPDVFAGFAIALGVSAAVGWHRLVRRERLCLAILLVFSAMGHSSHVLLLVALAGATLLATFLTSGKGRIAVVLMVLAATGGILGEQAFVHAVAHRLGEAPIRPPFLTARLINDGPGYRLLTTRCPEIGLTACRFVDRMPSDSDNFLWSRDPREGVFSTESLAVQRDLARQDTRFAIETVKHDPVGVATSSLHSIGRQVGLTDLNLFNYAIMSTDDLSSSIPEPFASEIRNSRYGRATMPVAFSRWANLATAIGAVLFLSAVALGRTRERPVAAVRTAAALILAAVALNAAITGALSKPHDRYNVRVIWVLQLATLAILASRSPRQNPEQN